MTPPGLLQFRLGPDGLRLSRTGENGAVFQLNPEEVEALLREMKRLVVAIQHPEGWSPPTMRLVGPASAGAMDNGDPYLMLWAEDQPHMAWHLTDEQAAGIVRLLQEVLATPRDMRFQPRRN